MARFLGLLIGVFDATARGIRRCSEICGGLVQIRGSRVNVFILNTRGCFSLGHVVVYCFREITEFFSFSIIIVTRGHTERLVRVKIPGSQLIDVNFTRLRLACMRCCGEPGTPCHRPTALKGGTKSRVFSPAGPCSPASSLPCMPSTSQAAHSSPPFKHRLGTVTRISALLSFH